MGDGRKAVTGLRLSESHGGSEVAPRDRKDSLIAAVALQQFDAEREKVSIGEDVVLEDYTLLDLIEELVDAGRYSFATAEICVLEIRPNFTVPGNAVDDAPSGRNFLDIDGIA